MSGYDFTGFTFNERHSSTFNFVRVSNGNRYEETTGPTFKDTTAAKTGADGTLYWESFYTQRTWNINIAFDSMTEENMRDFRRTFTGKNMGRLIFDELPFKYYNVKLQSPPQLKYICFDEGGRRIYKGEGTIQFVSYEAYGKTVHKFLNEFSDDNKNEWKNSTGMLNDGSDLTPTWVSDKYEQKVYNPGDVETDWILILKNLSQFGVGTKITLTFSHNAQSAVNSTVYTFAFNRPAMLSNDTYLRISSATNLLEGLDSNQEVTGNLYNSYMAEGDFFKILPTESSNNKDVLTIAIDGQSSEEPDLPIIESFEYDYLYF